MTVFCLAFITSLGVSPELNYFFQLFRRSFFLFQAARGVPLSKLDFLALVDRASGKSLLFAQSQVDQFMSFLTAALSAASVITPLSANCTFLAVLGPQLHHRWPRFGTLVGVFDKHFTHRVLSSYPARHFHLEIWHYWLLLLAVMLPLVFQAQPRFILQVSSPLLKALPLACTTSIPLSLI